MTDTFPRTDSNEEVWSRGSRTASIDTEPTPFVFDFQKQIPKPLIYKYEQGGTLIYLSTTDLSNKLLSKVENKQIAMLTKRSPSRNLEFLSSEKKIFLNSKKFPPKPDFSEDSSLNLPPHALRFNSKFESGNLKKVIMLSESVYNLYLENEGNNVCLQWYYFEVRNSRAQNAVFKISNLGKFESLYNEGMKPLVRSLKEGNEWKRGGTGVSYYQNPSEVSYTLSFSYYFAYPEDVVYFAYSYPYTYNDLLNDLEKVRECSEIARVDVICKSLCGNPVYMITVTEDINKYFDFAEEKHYSDVSAAKRTLLRKRKVKSGLKNEFSHRKGIFVTARVHPGETVSSFMMQGIFEFLIGPSRSAQILRKHFVFKLVPMINPDGVRYGKTRVSLSGSDLNRKWNDPHRLLHPCIYYTKKYLKVFCEMHECLMFCDLHGHSIKKNVFFYGCNEKPNDIDQSKKNIIARVIPYLLSKKNKLVSYKDSRFRMEKNKESTARITGFQELGIVSSLTLEASFYGPSSAEAYTLVREDLHMLPEDLKSIGKDLALILFTFLSPSHYIRILQNVSKYLREPVLTQKPVLITQESEEEIPSVNFQKDIINCETAWDGVNFDYQSEASSNSSASDIEEATENYYKKKVKTEIIRKPYKTVTPPILTRRQAKNSKAEKSEISLNPEAFFKMPGISVFSFNLRVKSSEMLKETKSNKERSKLILL